MKVQNELSTAGEIPYNQDSLWTWTNKWEAEQLWNKYNIYTPAALPRQTTTV